MMLIGSIRIEIDLLEWRLVDENDFKELIGIWFWMLIGIWFCRAMLMQGGSNVQVMIGFLQGQVHSDVCNAILCWTDIGQC